MHQLIGSFLILFLWLPTAWSQDRLSPEEIERNIIHYATQLVQKLPILEKGKILKIDPKSSKIEVITSIPFDNLNDVEKFGLANIFQTGKGGGSRAIEKRYLGEPILADQPNLKWHPTELHPKSSYLVSGGAINYKGFRQQYGDTFLLHRKSVWPRVSWVTGDSLDAINDILKYDEVAHTYNLLRESAKTIDFYANKIFDGEYAEALVWGPINLYDIEKVFVPQETFRENRQYLLNLAQKFGFALITYEPGESKTTTTIQMTKLKIQAKGRDMPDRPHVKIDFEEVLQLFKMETDSSRRLLYIDAMARSGDPRAAAYLQRMLEQTTIRLGGRPKRENMANTYLKGWRLEYEVLWQALKRDQELKKLKLMSPTATLRCPILLKKR